MNNSTTRTAVAAIYEQDDVVLVNLFTLDSDAPDRICWGFDGADVEKHWIKGFKVVQEYGLCNTPLRRRRIREAFAYDYTPIPLDVDAEEDPCLIGWLSPEGMFYPNTFAGHSGMANKIVNTFFKTRDDADDYPDGFLFKRGWLTLRNGYPGHHSHIDKTEAQLVFLDRLCLRNADYEAADTVDGSYPYCYSHNIGEFLDSLWRNYEYLSDDTV